MISQQLHKQNRCNQHIKENSKKHLTHIKATVQPSPTERLKLAPAGTERLKLAALNTMRRPAGTGSEVDPN